MYKRFINESNFKLVSIDASTLIDKYDNFAFEQSSECGLLSKKIIDRDLNDITFQASKRSQVYGSNPLFRGGTSLVITNDYLEEIKDFIVFPKHQKFNCHIKFRKHEIPSSLFYFYIDYIFYLDFNNSIFESYKRDVTSENGRRRIHNIIVNDSIKFDNINQLQEFRKANYRKGTSDKERLRPVKLFFKENVYKCDIIPSNYLSGWPVISERFANKLKLVENVEILDCKLPVYKN